MNINTDSENLFDFSVGCIYICNGLKKKAILRRREIPMFSLRPIVILFVDYSEIGGLYLGLKNNHITFFYKLCSPCILLAN